MEKSTSAVAWTRTLGILFLALKACAETTCLVSTFKVRPQSEETIREKGSLQLLECTKEPVTCANGVCSWNYTKTCLCRLLRSVVKSSCYDPSESMIEHNRDSPLYVPRVSCVAADLRRTGVFRTYAALSSCEYDWPQDDTRRHCEADDVTRNTSSTETVELVTSRSSGVTYKNKLCAICNRDTKTLIDWNRVYSGGKLLKSSFLYASYFKFTPPLCSGPSNVSDVRARWNSGATKFACRHAFSKPLKSPSDHTRRVKTNKFCEICFYTILVNVECYSSTETTDDEECDEESEISVLRNSSYANVYWVLRKFAANTDSVTGFISAFFLFLKVVVYAMDRSPRCFISRCTLCYALTLLTGQIIGYATLYFVTNTTYAVYELSFLVMLYFLQSSFLWTLVVSFDIWRALTASKRTLRQTKTLLIYGAFAWGTPCMLFTSMYFLQCGSENFTCFFEFMGGESIHVAIVVTPLVALAAELCFYAHVVVYVRKCRKASNEIGAQKTTGSSSRIRLFVKLAFVMCGTGLFRVVLSLPFFAPRINRKPLALVLYKSAYILSELLGGIPGTYVFFGFNDHIRLWRIISSAWCRKSCCLRSKSDHFSVRGNFGMGVAHLHKPTSYGQCKSAV